MLLKKDPKAKIRGTKMVFPGIKNEKEVDDLWAFLAQYDQRGRTPGSHEVVLVHRKADRESVRHAGEGVTFQPHPST